MLPGLCTTGGSCERTHRTACPLRRVGRWCSSGCPSKLSLFCDCRHEGAICAVVVVVAVVAVTGWGAEPPRPLRGADFRGADVRGADLRGAEFRE
ncbi:pentapeptide repeat-containing protein [Streptomyces sp. N2A]|uniref:pentapeptide repeat-containing protein n=1 Tax=Streptomyces sp. N2A TaxID=3073936 RepID=UPI0037D9A8D2